MELIYSLTIVLLIFGLLVYLLFKSIWFFLFYMKSYKRGILPPVYPLRGYFPFGSNLVIRLNKKQKVSENLKKEIYALKEWKNNKKDMQIVDYDPIKFKTTLFTGIIASAVMSLVFLGIIIYLMLTLLGLK
ncbi:MAG: hypothetical protein Q8N99_00725 [Nanoarchaeota archaeon]|nr:hypothetical protein [Nanoarchaeota archaeon]